MPKTAETCELPDRRLIPYYLKKRGRDKYYFACFKGPDGRRVERSTREPTNQRRAKASAVNIIRDAYDSKPTFQAPSWDEAESKMLEHMKAENLRPDSIQQYQLAVKVLRDTLPNTEGPCDVTPALAEQFKIERMKKVLPRTVRNNVNNLSIVYGCWWRDHCKILDSNPFADVTPPREDKDPPRIIAEDEQHNFFSWLEHRWNWRLPLLFLEVKAQIGCRIGELAAARSENLRDGRIYFTSETTKGRKARACLLPKKLFAALRGEAGPTFVFEAFPDQLRSIHRRRGNHHHVKAVKNFSPKRVVGWLQDQLSIYFEKTGAKKFKLHNFRGTAMSRARMAGIGESDAAIAFGCTPGTMREHYLNLDEEAIADAVFERI